MGSWCLYDWANSAFPTIISTFVFATYFTTAVAEDTNAGTAQWGYALSIAAIVIAVVSPPLGAAADRMGRRKPWLALTTLMCIGGTAAMWFVQPDPTFVLPALLALIVATVGFEVATVFYNAMLPELISPQRMGRLSGWAWGLGYAGGLVCLVIALTLFVQRETPPFGLDKESAEHVRATFLLVALWYAAFAWPLFLFVPDRGGDGMGPARAMREGLAAMTRLLRDLRSHPNVLRYLIARMIYTDGLNTLFSFGGIYAAGTFGMSFSEIIQFGIGMNLAAGVGAASFGWVDDRIGPKRTVMISIVALIGIGIMLLVIETKTQFWVFGLLLSVFFGPVQAASRTFMARLAPESLRTEMFGLYALSGKITAFMGPAVLGWATVSFGSQRAGMATILVFLVVGGALLLSVKEPPVEA
ncbi:MAG: MFS transporter [Acetobacterales bacterium]